MLALIFLNLPKHMKTCKTCKEELPLDKFYRQYNFPQYYLANCKFCYLQNKKEYYKRKKQWQQ